MLAWSDSLVNRNGRRCDGDDDDADVKEGEQAVRGDETVKVVVSVLQC